ncbi:MAG: hypothetical protein KJ831_10945, partial [Candidatus Eisenbacteria bacterium]|nr:hypothetical protein [Candidatus Eisenbacteria bacterium]
MESLLPGKATKQDAPSGSSRPGDARHGFPSRLVCTFEIGYHHRGSREGVGGGKGVLESSYPLTLAAGRSFDWST